MPSACWYLVNLPRPVAIVLAKLRGLMGIGQQGLAPGAQDPPPVEGREAGGTEEGQTKTQPGIPTANSPPTDSQHLGHSTQPSLFTF